MGNILISILLIIQSLTCISNIKNLENLTFNELSSFFYENFSHIPVQNESEYYLYEFTEEESIVKNIYFKNMKDIEAIVNIWEEIPQNLLICVENIYLIPESRENVAGTVGEDGIYLFKFSSYSKKDRKYIICHELAHAWGRKLMEKKLVDYDYFEYKEAVKKDNNYITKYSKGYILEKENYSEDFADSVAKYVLNGNKLSERYSNREKYIKKMFELSGVEIL